MQEGTPRPHTFVTLLKACASQKDLHGGSRLHADIIKLGLLGRNSFVATALISMYAKCGSLAEAQDVFDKLPIKDVVIWNALTSGYVQHGHFEQALECFRQMQMWGLYQDAVTYVCMLKACGWVGATDEGQEIHNQILRKGMLENDIVVATALVDMYGKCGLLAKAQEVFDKFPVHDSVMWSVLIAGYVQHGHEKQALHCFKSMQLEGVSPNTCTFLSVLKACGSIGAVYKGQEIHAEIASEGILEGDIAAGNALVDMYAKCGMLPKAQEVCDKLLVRDVVTWSVLITGYAQYGHGEQTLKCFECMQLESLSPNAGIFACILKACGSIGAAEKGQEIHAEVVKKGFLEKDVAAGNALVDMYAKCGQFAEAEEVCDKLPTQSVTAWTALIAGYTQHRHAELAVKCFERMQLTGLSPNGVTFACILKACGSIGALNKGEEIHGEIEKEGLLEKDIVVGNALVDMYAKCGSIAKAQDVFDNLLAPDVISWNELIAGYAQHGHTEQALNCFKQMQAVGCSPNSVTFSCILKACGSMRATDMGRTLHEEIVKERWLEKDVIVGNALIDMYAKCGLIATAEEVFDQLPVCDLVTWNVLIAGYVQNGHSEKALNCYESMQLEGPCPNAVTFACILKACGSIGDISKGQEIHAEIVREGLFEKEIIVGNALVDVYAKCGLVVEAQVVFDKLPLQDVVSWNALIGGYANHEHSEQALNCYEQMKMKGLRLDAVTFACIVKACGTVGAIDKGQEIHAEIVREGLLEKCTIIGNALINMYAKFGMVAKSEEVFDMLLVHDVISWSMLIAGYTQHGHGEQAVICFEQMLVMGLSPNTATFASILKACGSIGAADKGQLLHTKIAKEGLLENDSLVGTALIDMYAKCGLFVKAQEVFDMLQLPNVISWNALITGYALLGKSEHVFHLFDRMVKAVKPDLVTFTIVLNACSHTGLLDECQMFFEIMSRWYVFRPTFEHHNCMVDLFARAGDLHKAVALIMMMPFAANLQMWHAVLGASCRIRGTTTIGKLAFENAVQLDQNDTAAYVSMSNIYADANYICAHAD